jgi:hypothetical protein
MRLKWTGSAILAASLLSTMCAAYPLRKQKTGSEPLHVTIHTDKTQYKPGDSIRVEVELTNRSARPIVLAKAIHDGTPAGYVALEGARDGRRIEYGDGKSSMPPAGVGARYRVFADHFTTLAPGKSVIVYWREFDGRYDIPPDKQFRTKQEYFDAGHSPLEPGEYTITARYGFAREPAVPPTSWRRLKFADGAEPLYQNAWTGTVSGKTTFRVERVEHLQADRVRMAPARSARQRG